MALTTTSWTIAQGGRGSMDMNASQRIIDMSDKITWLEPNANPLLQLTSKLRKKAAKSYKVEWLEDAFLPKNTLTTAASSAADTTIDVTTNEGNYFKAGDLIMVPRTGEVMRVTSVAASVLTVTRAWAGSAAALHASSVADELFCVGYAGAEYAGAPSMILTQVSALYNYTQIFRSPLGASRTVTQTDMYTGNERDYLRNKTGKEHAIDIERAMFFGKRAATTTTVSSATRDIRSMGGLTQYVTTNVTSMASTGLASLTVWEDFLRTGFRYGSDTKFFFCSPLTIQKINELAMGKLHTMEGEDTLGLAIKQYVSGHGTVNLVKCKLFDSVQTTGMGFLVDLENITLRPLQDTILRTNIQQPDLDGWADEYLTELTMEVKNEKTHAILKNTDGGAF